MKNYDLKAQGSQKNWIKLMLQELHSTIFLSKYEQQTGIIY
jgi:hypothetical protein